MCNHLNRVHFIDVNVFCDLNGSLKPHLSKGDSARTKSIAVTKLLKLLFNNFALDKHALHYALCLL